RTALPCTLLGLALLPAGCGRKQPPPADAPPAARPERKGEEPPAAVPPGQVEPLAEWSGVLRDDKLRKEAPKDPWITDRAAWAKLWRAWRKEEKVPAVDFRKELVLVFTAHGPNQPVLVLTRNARGDVTMAQGGTLLPGRGFGYLIWKVKR